MESAGGNSKAERAPRADGNGPESSAGKRPAAALVFNADGDLIEADHGARFLLRISGDGQSHNLTRTALRLLGPRAERMMILFRRMMRQRPRTVRVPFSLNDLDGRVTVSPGDEASLGEELPEPPMVTKVVREAYLNPSAGTPIRASKGERIIGTRGGSATLYRRRVGRGQFIYIGWPISSSLTSVLMSAARSAW